MPRSSRRVLFPRAVPILIKALLLAGADGGGTPFLGLQVHFSLVGFSSNIGSEFEHREGSGMPTVGTHLYRSMAGLSQDPGVRLSLKGGFQKKKGEPSIEIPSQDTIFDLKRGAGHEEESFRRRLEQGDVCLSKIFPPNSRALPLRILRGNQNFLILRGGEPMNYTLSGAVGGQEEGEETAEEAVDRPSALSAGAEAISPAITLFACLT